MSKSIIIIGAGISGLSAGCYGQMNGYNTQIFEMDVKPGGLCTSWQRQGYTIDCCIHWLVGTKPGSEYYKMWQELGMIQDKQIINLDEFYQVRDVEGKTFHCYTNLQRLEKHMIELSPEDTEVTSELVRAIRSFIGFPILIEKAPELSNIVDGLKVAMRMRSYLGVYRIWNRISVGEFASRFKSELLRKAFEIVWFRDTVMTFVLMTMAELHEKTAGYPIGGSMGLSHSVEKRYLDLGGKISYKSKVEKVLVENDRAAGVKLTDGSEHRSNYFISACDVHASVFDMLDGKYIDDTITRYFKERPIYPPLIFVGIGVRRTFKDIPGIMSGIVLPLNSPIITGNKECNWLSVRIHKFDPSLAPEGKTVITAIVESDYEYWESLHQDMSRYNTEKTRAADIITATLEKHFPGLSQQIDVVDVATPYTFYRFTNNWQGGYMGWMPTPQYANLYMSKRLPGLDNFFMISQWIQPSGGIPSVAINGSHVIQILCKEDGKKFTTRID